MRLTLLLFTASAAYAQTIQSVAGERLPSWLHLSGEHRTRVEGRTGFNYQPGNNDAYALIRHRLNVEIAPTPWLDCYFQGQDSRAPGLDAGRPQATFRNTFDIRQAYVRLGDPKGPVRLTVGRQLLSYGAQRLIGPLDWTNTSRNWDAIKLEVGTADAKLDLFASSVVVVDPTRPDHHRDGFNLHGVYGSLKKVVPKSLFEPYLLWKTGRVSIWTVGVRVAAMPGTPGLHGFDYQGEFAQQWGRAGAIRHSAAAGYAIVGYTTGKARWSPRLSAEYSHASGDPDPASGKRRTFDHLLGTNHLFYGISDPIGWQNMNMARVGLDFKPHSRVQWHADYHDLWLDSAADALYTVAGTVAARPLVGNTARRIGSEISCAGVWSVSSQWKIGGGVGRLAAGDFLKRNTHGSGQTFPYLFAQYSY
jgi:hypothetical protein